MTVKRDYITNFSVSFTKIRNLTENEMHKKLGLQEAQVFVYAYKQSFKVKISTIQTFTKDGSKDK